MAAPALFLLDTSYLVALVTTNDDHHDIAVAWTRWLEQRHARFLTHEGILTEIGDGFARPARRITGIQLLERLTTDPIVEIAPLDASLRSQALELYRSRPDKDWGLTDCASFVLMTARGVSAALTTDQHFLQAGFRAVLTEEPPA
ncbi:MAG: type II toxin-antitoxin system VapC family toxin [Candidatus Riflebacteria bacterium]|nr:type II toxin-antitoxin system VapC family toxin [Candidatus Riflebacteria bacterium]